MCVWFKMVSVGFNRRLSECVCVCVCVCVVVVQNGICGF